MVGSAEHEENALASCAARCVAPQGSPPPTSPPLPAATPLCSLWDPRAAAALLQESHAAHAYCGAAEEHAQAMAALYEAFARDVAGLPVVAGRRSARGTLRGAAATYTVEALVGQGRALQVRRASSSHAPGGLRSWPHMPAPHAPAGAVLEPLALARARPLSCSNLVGSRPLCLPLLPGGGRAPPGRQLLHSAGRLLL